MSTNQPIVFITNLRLRLYPEARASWDELCDRWLNDDMSSDDFKHGNAAIPWSRNVYQQLCKAVDAYDCVR